MPKIIESDATPIPPTEPKVEEPESPPTERKQNEKKYSSDDSSSSDSESESEGRNANVSKGEIAKTVININKARDVHIGNSYNYSQNFNAYSHHHYTETDSTSHYSPSNDKGPKPSEELLESMREIDADDMYVVAENISRKWKKLARLLPPACVFTEGQLKTFEDNNPHDQEEAIVEMLGSWKLKYPEQATIGILALTLWKIGRGDIARKLKS